MRLKLIRRIFGLLPAAACAALYAYSANHPATTEEVYSERLYPQIVERVIPVVSRVGFSVAELVVVALALLVVCGAFRALHGLFSERGAEGKLGAVLRPLLNAVSLAGAIFPLFVLMWGLNYNRLPLAEAAGLPVGEAPVSELRAACEQVLARANELRGQVAEDENGVMKLSVSRRESLDRAADGFTAVSLEFPTIGAVTPGRPKPVFLSEAMNYAQITGIYFPITAEANVNANVQDVEAPFTACHELSHQQGYAREDEANFIAWLVCNYSPYDDYRYSGNLMALLHLLNRLAAEDAGAYASVRAQCSAGVDRDLASLGSFWRQYEGPVSEISETVNDAYLRANRQEDGVKSYGRMADLIIAYLRDH